MTEQEAIDLLPEDDEIHTFYNPAFGLIGADWNREDIIDKIRKSDCREVTGSQARAMKHGLALYSKVTRLQSDVLFVETNMDLLDSLYPDEEGD